MNRQNFSALIAALAGLIVLSTSPAEARYRRHSAAFCTPDETWQGELDMNWWRVGNFGAGVFTNGSSGINWAPHGLVCPVGSDSEFPHGDVVDVNIHGIDMDDGAVGSVGAQLCVDYFDFDGINHSGNAGECSGFRYSGSSPTSISASRTYVGDYAIHFDTGTTPDVSTFTSNPGHWPTIYVLLPGRGPEPMFGNNGYSTLSGYFIGD